MSMNQPIFDSGISRTQLAQKIRNETAINPVYGNADGCGEIYGDIVELEQILYSEVIRMTELANYVPSLYSDNFDNVPEWIDATLLSVDLSGRIDRPSDDRVCTPLFSDVTKVFIGTDEYIKTSVSAFYTFEAKRCFTYDNAANDKLIIRYNGAKQPEEIYCRVLHIVRPMTYGYGYPGDCDNVALPAEWIPMIEAKVRGEMYKRTNENDLAVKWLGDYNALLEDFKVWCDRRRPAFGGQ